MDVDALFDEAADGSFLVSVHAQPGARNPGVAGTHGDALRIRVREPADRGRANAAITRELAAALGLRGAQVTLAAGSSSRAKRFRIDGCTRAELRAALRAVTDSGGA
jgi:uncharacterized protein (TIGR00251 family)